MLHCGWTRLEDDHSHPALGSGQEGSSHIFAHNPFMTIFQFKKKKLLTNTRNNRTAFSLLESPEATETITCSNATGAAISATPYLVPVVDGDCAPGSGFNFSFRQLQDYAVELSVKHAESGRVATWTSGTESVTTTTTGDDPFDTLTSYVGPREFALAF